MNGEQVTRWLDRMFRGLALAGGIVVVAFFALTFVFVVFPGTALVLFALVVGVWEYPASVFPRATFGRDVTTTGIVALCVVLGGVHATATWLRRSMAGDGTRTWTLRSTLAVTGALLVAFAVAVDVAAVVHQSAWLISAPPKSVIFDSRRDTPVYVVSNACAHLQRPIPDPAALFASALTNEQWEVELLRRPDGSLGGVLARARDPRHAMAGRVFACKDVPFVSDAEIAAYVAASTSPVR